MNKSNGLTAIEMLVSLAIAAILTATAIPSLSRFVDRHRLESGVQKMTRGLALARSEAIRRSTRVSMASEHGRWEDGWKIFEDRDNDGVPDSDDAVLYEQAPTQGISVQGNLPVQALITFQAEGYSVLPNGGFQAGTLRICPTDPSIPGYKIVLGRGGRNHVQRLTDQSVDCPPP